MKAIALVFALIASVPTAASAKAWFNSHQGDLLILHGEGGISHQSHGITVWTKGAPHANFQVIGVISDDRSDKLLSGTALDSRSIARLVRAHGGDAVLVHDVALSPIGVERGGVGGVINTPSFSDQRDVQINSVRTHLIVIKAPAAGNLATRAVRISRQ